MEMEIMKHYTEPSIKRFEIALNAKVAQDLHAMAKLYRTSAAGMVGIVLAYYFGDGADHLRCEDCELWRGYCVGDSSQGEQLTFNM